jgi:phage terminase large subunit-like protein
LGQLALRQARDNPNRFVSLAFTDSSGRPLRQSAVHRNLQSFLSDHHKALVELPRDHGKSTQVCARVVWELGRDPSLRIKIVCASQAIAAERGRFIRQAIESSPWLPLIFPNLEPARPWTDTRLTVMRPANVLGPSVAAMSIGETSTGSRADLLVCDDIVDFNALASRHRRERVKSSFNNNLMNLLEPDGRFWGLCTPWHRDDLNAELKRNLRYDLFRRAIGDDLEPVWPERWSREALQRRRDEIGTSSFARGYRLVPLADEDQMIHESKIKFWTVPVESKQVILSVDPAVSTNARADRSALVVLARCGNEIRCLDAFARRVSMNALIALIDRADAQWHPEVILFESNAAFTGIADLIIRHAPFGPKIKEVKQSSDKGSRVSSFSVPVENGSFQLKGDGQGGVDPSQKELFDEMTMYPVGEHDDLLDAAATGTAYLLGVPEPRVIVL